MTRSEWVAGFWRRVFKTHPTKCWLWTGTLKDGYGQLKQEDGQTNIYAHRAAVEIVSGKKVPSHLVVMHTCDTPRCVNPRHLRVATQRANVRDMHRKGRAPDNRLTGDAHGSTKISDADVADIRRLWDNRRTTKVTQTALARRYGVTQAQISRIVNKKRRK